MIKKRIGMVIAGCAAGAVNGFLGAGGGMLLVPLLSWLTDLPENEIFPSSVAVILPICLISLLFSTDLSSTPWSTTVYYLTGSAAGGILAGIAGKHIPTLWLHRGLGILVIWGGIRSLC